VWTFRHFFSSGRPDVINADTTPQPSIQPTFPCEWIDPQSGVVTADLTLAVTDNNGVGVTVPLPNLGIPLKEKVCAA
jgi:hypothetical protein